MPHTIEPAPTGRAKCRGCGSTIAKGDLRLGEVMPNPFAEGEMTHWFHLRCAAYKRPEPFLEAVAGTTETVADRDALTEAAQQGIAHPNLVRIDGAERATSGRARCRQCKEAIASDAWRIRLADFAEGRPVSGGFLHLECRKDYFETDEIEDRLRHFSPALGAQALDELSRALRG